jgi:hypothetical protein
LAGSLVAETASLSFEALTYGDAVKIAVILKLTARVLNISRAFVPVSNMTPALALAAQTCSSTYADI